MKTIKVSKDIREVKSKQCVEGKLVLIESKDSNNPINKIGDICRFDYGLNIAGKEDLGYPVVTPIIISETEEINMGDSYIDDTNSIRVNTTNDKDYWAVRTD